MKWLALLLFLLIPVAGLLLVAWLLGWFMPGMRVLPNWLYGRKRS